MKKVNIAMAWSRSGTIGESDPFAFFLWKFDSINLSTAFWPMKNSRLSPPINWIQNFLFYWKGESENAIFLIYDFFYFYSVFDDNYSFNWEYEYNFADISTTQILCLKPYFYTSILTGTLFVLVRVRPNSSNLTLKTLFIQFWNEKKRCET